MPRLSVLLVCALLFVACDDTPPTLTSSAELAERMRDRFEASIGGVPGFTVLAGGYQATYAIATDTALAAAGERVRVALAPTDSVAADPLVQLLVGSHVPNVPLLAQGLAGTPLDAPFERDGHRVYAVEAGQTAGLDGASGGASLRVFVDAATFDVREVYRVVRMDSLERPLTMRLLYDDFRTADGVTLPWRLRVIQEGLDQLQDPDALVMMRGSLNLQRQQLRAAPPGPERERRLAEIDRQLRLIDDGIEEARVTVRRVTVTP